MNSLSPTTKDQGTHQRRRWLYLIPLARRDLQKRAPQQVDDILRLRAPSPAEVTRTREPYSLSHDSRHFHCIQHNGRLQRAPRNSRLQFLAALPACGQDHCGRAHKRTTGTSPNSVALYLSINPCPQTITTIAAKRLNAFPLLFVCQVIYQIVTIINYYKLI